MTFDSDLLRVAHRLWSIRLLLLCGAFNGLIAVWSAFQDVLPLWLFASLSVAMNMTVLLARLTKQPGIDE